MVQSRGTITTIGPFYDFFKLSLLKPEQCLSVINVLMVILIGNSNLLCQIKLNCDVSGDISAIYN